MSVELAPYYVPFMCVATSIQARSAANGLLKLVTIVYKEIYSAQRITHVTTMLQLRIWYDEGQFERRASSVFHVCSDVNTSNIRC